MTIQRIEHVDIVVGVVRITASEYATALGLAAGRATPTGLI